MTKRNAFRHLLLSALLCCIVSGTGLTAGPETAPSGGAAAPADATAPMPTPVEFARKATEGLFTILRDPELQGDRNVQERYERVREDSGRNFDWQEMARRSLGRHWNKITEAQREQFTALFSHLIANTYLTTIERNLGVEIRYEGEQVEEKHATVKTIAVTDKGTEVPIIYWVRTAQVPNEPPATGTRAGWLVYDIQIEGVSMVANYRSQFNDVIIGSSYEKLVEKLKAKVAEAAKGRADKAEAAGPAPAPAPAAAGEGRP